jgi:hypothetical protein
MDKNLERISDNLPEKRSRSRLEPYGALIREQLRRNRTYREIAGVLLDGFQIHASISTIHDFIRRWTIPDKSGRTRTEKVQRKVGKDATSTPVKTKVPNADAPVISDEVQKRIAALKSRPIPATETKIFHYDPEQPLQISSPREESDK